MKKVASVAATKVWGLTYPTPCWPWLLNECLEPRFIGNPFSEVEFPPCLAVTAIGEVFNYLFDARNPRQRLSAVFGRIHKALCPGGMFLFDLAEPGRVRGSGPQRGYAEGRDWACLYAAEEDRRGKTLTRTITTFRKSGEHRRHGEVHRLRFILEPTS